MITPDLSNTDNLSIYDSQILTGWVTVTFPNSIFMLLVFPFVLGIGIASIDCEKR